MVVAMAQRRLNSIASSGGRGCCLAQIAMALAHAALGAAQAVARCAESALQPQIRSTASPSAGNWRPRRALPTDRKPPARPAAQRGTGDAPAYPSVSPARARVDRAVRCRSGACSSQSIAPVARHVHRCAGERPTGRTSSRAGAVRRSDAALPRSLACAASVVVEEGSARFAVGEPPASSRRGMSDLARCPPRAACSAATKGCWGRCQVAGGPPRDYPQSRRQPAI